MEESKCSAIESLKTLPWHLGSKPQRGDVTWDFPGVRLPSPKEMQLCASRGCEVCHILTDGLLENGYRLSEGCLENPGQVRVSVYSDPYQTELWVQSWTRKDLPFYPVPEEWRRSISQARLAR